jgi:amidase
VAEQPSQEVLENALKDNMTDEEYHSGLKHLRQSVRDAVENCLRESQADVIMASGESLLPSIAASAGYPLGAVPLGFSTCNGRPFGMEIMARNGEEEKILEVMSAWESTFPDARSPPPLLLDWREEP